MFRTLVALGLATVLLASSAQAIERQRRMYWCWAACIEAVEGSAGISTTQEAIARKLDGWGGERPAHIQEVARLLQADGFRAMTVLRPPANPMELYGTLNSGWKMIAFGNPMGGQVGHFVVLEKADAGGAIYLSDPMDGSTRAVSPQALFMQFRWGASVVVGTPARRMPPVGDFSAPRVFRSPVGRF